MKKRMKRSGLIVLFASISLSVLAVNFPSEGYTPFASADEGYVPQSGEYYSVGSYTMLSGGVPGEECANETTTPDDCNNCCDGKFGDSCEEACKGDTACEDQCATNNELCQENCINPHSLPLEGGEWWMALAVLVLLGGRLLFERVRPNKLNE